MSGLQGHVDEYLRLRRAVGFKLKEDERLLGQLVTHVKAAGATTVTSELAISWARLPVGVHPNRWAKRLRIARGFAAYLQTIDPTTEIPPPDVFPVRRQRATPYLFSQQDICRLLAEARRLPHPMRAASYEALFGLLAVSGMRIGGGGRTRALRRRPRRRLDHDPQSQRRPRPAGATAPDRHRGVAALRVRARPPVPDTALARVLHLQRRHPRARS